MPADSDTLAQQIAQMQTQLAFQEDAIGSLDQALANQQQEILLLRRQLELLHERQRDAYSSAHGDAPAPPVDEKPPHY
jgi:SlyX protein